MFNWVFNRFYFLWASLEVTSVWGVSEVAILDPSVNFEADTMFRYSFKILPDRLKLTWMYPCGSLGQSISFVFGAQVGHFAATPQSDIVGIWSRDLGVMATLSAQREMSFFRAFITLRSQFHLHHHSQ